VTKGPLLARLHSRLRMRHMLLLKVLGTSPNLRRAAATLHLSQPVASTLLRELEDAFGERLFERTVHGLEPTAAGKAMARWAMLVLADLESARDDLKSIAQGGVRRLRIGVSPVAAPALLPRALNLLLQRYPKASFAIQTGVESALTALVIEGSLDCVVCRLVPEADDSALTYKTLYSEKSDVVVGARHPLTSGVNFKPAELDTYDWILPMSSGAPFNLVARRLLDVGCALPRVVIETWSTVVIVNLLQFGDWLAVLPRSIARQHAKAGSIAVLPFELPDALLPLAVITRRGVAGDEELVRALVESVQTVAADLSTERQSTTVAS
jgi:DNA-binding transcriptional LysR family regulator